MTDEAGGVEMDEVNRVAEIRRQGGTLSSLA